MNTLLYVLAAFAACGLIGFAGWPYIKGFFKDSETLFFARLQMAIGALIQALAATDLLPIFDAAGIGKYFPVWLLISGFITELARRNRDEM